MWDGVKGHDLSFNVWEENHALLFCNMASWGTQALYLLISLCCMSQFQILYLHSFYFEGVD